jgi:hypothetical protein
MEVRWHGRRAAPGYAGPHHPHPMPEPVVACPRLPSFGPSTSSTPRSRAPASRPRQARRARSGRRSRRATRPAGPGGGRSPGPTSVRARSGRRRPRARARNHKIASRPGSPSKAGTKAASTSSRVRGSASPTPRCSAAPASATRGIHAGARPCHLIRLGTVARIGTVWSWPCRGTTGPGPPWRRWPPPGWPGWRWSPWRAGWGPARAASSGISATAQRSSRPPSSCGNDATPPRSSPPWRRSPIPASGCASSPGRPTPGRPRATTPTPGCWPPPPILGWPRSWNG